MKKGRWILLLLFVGLFCTRPFSLDDFLFDPSEVDEYLRPADMDEDWHVRFIIPNWQYQGLTLTSMDNTIYAYFVYGNPDSITNNDVTILYCHGRSENINRYWGRVEYFWEMGYNVFIFDYQGYGKSEGSPSGEAFYSDGYEALNYLLSRPNVDPSKIVYYGQSLGCFVAAYLSADVRPGAAVILESSPASATALLHDGALVHLPADYVVEVDFDNEKRIADIDCPLLMMHGRDDDYVVFDRHVPYLWDKAVQPKESLWVDGAVHDDVPEVLGAEYHTRIIEFINTYVNN